MALSIIGAAARFRLAVELGPELVDALLRVGARRVARRRRRGAFGSAWPLVAVADAIELNVAGFRAWGAAAVADAAGVIILGGDDYVFWLGNRGAGIIGEIGDLLGVVAANACHGVPLRKWRPDA
jgi:hypothetical protein